MDFLLMILIPLNVLILISAFAVFDSITKIGQRIDAIIKRIEKL